MIAWAQVALAGECTPSRFDVLKELDDGSCPVDWAYPPTGTTLAHEFADRPELLRELIARGVPVDRPNALGTTPLGRAARFGAIESMELLVAAGARLDPPDARAPLCGAIGAGASWLLAHGASPRPTTCVPVVDAFEFVPTMEELVQAGADASQPVLDDALRVAVLRQREDTVEWLLAHGADPARPRADGATLPWLATELESIDTATPEVLLAAGVAPGRRPLDRAPYAVAVWNQFGASELGRRLLATADLGERDAAGRTARDLLGPAVVARLADQPPAPRVPVDAAPRPERGVDRLTLAIQTGDEARVREILARGADPDGLAGEGAPLAAALEASAWRRRLGAQGVPGGYVDAMAPSPPAGLVGALLQAGADPNRCAGGRCPLVRAATGEDPDAVAALLEAGATPDPEAVAAAAAAGAPAVLRALLDAGVPVGRALDRAAAAGRVDLLTTLAEAGSPVDDAALVAAITEHTTPDVVRWLLARGVSAHGEEPIRRAADAERVDLVRILLAAGAPASSAALAAARPGGPVFRELLAAGADPDARDDGGRTSVERALELGDVEAVGLALSAGADPDLPLSDGRLPIELALETRQDWAAVALLDAGADPEAPSGDRLTPLHVAARAGRADVVRWLLASGVEVDPAAVDGTTPLMLAADLGDADTVGALLEAHARRRRARDDGLRAVDFACAQSDAGVRAAFRCRSAP